MHDPPRPDRRRQRKQSRDPLRAPRRSGYATAEACDGVEALEGSRENPADLILLVGAMPRMDGLEACRLLKADSSIGFIPIILVTARSNSKDVVARLRKREPTNI